MSSLRYSRHSWWRSSHDPMNRAVSSTSMHRLRVASSHWVLASALATTASTPASACDSMRNEGMSLHGTSMPPSGVGVALGVMAAMPSKYHCIGWAMTSRASSGCATGVGLRRASSCCEHDDMVGSHRNVGPSNSSSNPHSVSTKSTICVSSRYCAMFELSARIVMCRPLAAAPSAASCGCARGAGPVGRAGPVRTRFTLAVSRARHWQGSTMCTRPSQSVSRTRFTWRPVRAGAQS